jgi:hypothetical protein
MKHLNEFCQFLHDAEILATELALAAVFIVRLFVEVKRVIVNLLR